MNWIIISYTCQYSLHKAGHKHDSSKGLWRAPSKLSISMLSYLWHIFEMPLFLLYKLLKIKDEKTVKYKCQNNYLKNIITKLTYHCCGAFQRMPIELVLYRKGCLDKLLVHTTGRQNVPLQLILMTARNLCLTSLTIVPFQKKETAVMVTISLPKVVKTWQIHLSFKHTII